jgi:competence protein ComFC
MPAHKKRIKKYGFNQVESIAREFCKLKNFKMCKNILQKNREVQTQHFLSREERFENIKESFRVNLKNYNGENLLVIDDITTSGATLEEIIKTFKNAGVQNITCLTVFKQF